MLVPVGRVHARRAVLYPPSSSAPPGPRCVVPMTILNLYFMQGSIKECLVASEQDRDLLPVCTLQPSRIVTMLLSMLTSAALFRYPTAPCILTGASARNHCAVN